MARIHDQSGGRRGKRRRLRRTALAATALAAMAIMATVAIVAAITKAPTFLTVLACLNIGPWIALLIVGDAVYRHRGRGD